MKFGVDCAMKCRPVLSLGTIALALLLTGCMRDSKPTQFYMLNADSGVADTARLPATTQGPVIGLGPIRIPEYVSAPSLLPGLE